MPAKVHVCYYYDKPGSGEVINTTSRSKNWSKDLSPFYLGPVHLYKNYRSRNVENAWQYSKVYKDHIDSQGNPTEEYWQWAENGWNNSFAVRYPMGKGTIPEYSYWNGEKLSYIEARKKIYIPLYKEAVIETETFSILRGLYNQENDIWLMDFDGYDHEAFGFTLDDVVNNPHKKMGHAFVLKMMLEGYSLNL